MTPDVNSDNKCKQRCQPIIPSVPHLTPARTVRHTWTWYQGHYFGSHVSHTPVFVFSNPLLPCCLVRIYIFLILQAYASSSYLNILTFNNFIFCTLPTDNWQILNTEVSIAERYNAALCILLPDLISVSEFANVTNSYFHRPAEGNFSSI